MAKTEVAKNYREQIAEEAKALAARLQAPSGDFIKVTQDKQFIMPDGTKSAAPMRCVILDFVAGNFFYDRPFKAGENVPPACFALGAAKNENLVPHATSPVKQADSCAEKVCPNNMWGSKGAGKACSNSRILALVQPDADENTKPMMLKLSATAIAPFDAYVGTIKAQFDTLPIGVITDIYFDPNSIWASLRFGNPEENPNLEVHFALKAAALQRMLTPLDVSKYEAPTKKGKKA